MGHGHDHPHDHDHTEVAGSWRDPEAGDRLSVSRRRFLAGAVAAGAAAGLGSTVAGLGQGVAAAAPKGRPTPVNPWTGTNRFLAGDHHIHTQFSPDAQYEVETQVSKAAEYGLDWMVVTDHGGTAHQKYSIDQVTPRIEASREAHRDLLVYQGLEWNIPGAEHATVFLPPGANSVEILRAFEAGYDGSVLADQKKVVRSTSGDGEPFALEALRYLDQQVRGGRAEIALMFANHPARRGIDSPHEIRNWRDAAPEVAVGMEGAPGHQAAGIPLDMRGPGKARGYYDFAPTEDSFPGYAPSATENPYRTYGGFDWMTAKVGGLWDSLLAEGRPWWVTSTSDSHQVWLDTLEPGEQPYATTGSRGTPIDTGVQQTGYGDFWPGYYSSTLVAAQRRTYVSVMRGLQAGQVIAVHGRLIEGMDVRVRATRGDGDARGVTLGGRTHVQRGGDVQVELTIELAAGPNAAGMVPKLAKVDLISGPVTGAAADRDTLSAPQTSVVETFEVPAGARKRVRLEHTFRNVQQSFYLRVRGSDGNQLDSAGNPLIDVAGAEDPFADLWFYANPVFVDVLG
ncbi:histidinol-phosphatase [Modestobacter sp. I12A-02628]|uniref:Histidinol-phosphatase n=1 Tax=Goekera deserti TaxID=2497753 RepID=A0A7K3W8X0_9ACTN|nr:PHP domain-containing protein [Goekera deserti]MPR00430.1 histidinol-phosphatase [Goekera deserti]NDI49173.1 histidinol-phosphatase [Goekera deserti]NEL52911.1 histidinol-phosphatase [Goekera deserti]